MKGLKVPFIANIPVEKEIELNQQVDAEIVYEKSKLASIEKRYNKINSPLRKVGTYIYNWFADHTEISIEKIANDLNMNEYSVRILICELNYCDSYPLPTLMPVPKKRGYFQLVTKNQEHYERWDKRKMRTIVSMTHVREKANTIVSARMRVKKKLTVQQEKKKKKEAQQ
jgi:hypothetical protein